MEKAKGLLGPNDSRTQPSGLRGPIPFESRQRDTDQLSHFNEMRDFH